MSPATLAMMPNADTAGAGPALVDIIDFKWLMAAEGHRVHVERLQFDAVYAQACLAQAAGSPTAALRSVAERLRAHLG